MGTINEACTDVDVSTTPLTVFTIDEIMSMDVNAHKWFYGLVSKGDNLYLATIYEGLGFSIISSANDVDCDMVIDDMMK